VKIGIMCFGFAIAHKLTELTEASATVGATASRIRASNGFPVASQIAARNLENVFRWKVDYWGVEILFA
jgi:hypothetical protein